MVASENALQLDENYQKLEEFIISMKDTKGSLIPILHKAQDLFGYLPLEIQKFISTKTQIPLSEIYGVVSFYSFFNMEPKGKYQINVCMGTACYVKGADKLLDKIKNELDIEEGGNSEDNLFSLRATRCIGACGLAPVILINEDVYGRLEEAKIPEILNQYKE